ncbi:MAG: hypothetical protein E6I75_21035 [Chloroflexi bacterium]|nr:MAG: hypothetical protein E6I75_21035 [Chloroflexota bacterium]
MQGNTVLGPGHAAAVVRVEGTRKGLALTTDCNPRYMRIDPRRGAAQAVAEAARNIACVGAEPIAVTDCLNFGNPEKPTVAWQLTEAVEGMAEACRALCIPIVSGNVSLYNETGGRAIPPTPTIGMVGLLEDVSLAVPTGFRPGCALVLLGGSVPDVGSRRRATPGTTPARARGAAPAVLGPVHIRRRAGRRHRGICAAGRYWCHTYGRRPAGDRAVLRGPGPRDCDMSTRGGWDGPLTC